MYQPEHFRLADRATIFGIVRTHPLAQVITHGPDGLEANLVPMILHAEEGEHGVLRAHLARPNGQWHAIAAGAELLVVFQGVERYVTPAWYATKRETGKVVPTWNYVTVQARGSARIVEDAGWMRAHLESLTAAHEGLRAEPWAVSDAPDAYISAMMRGIVGLELVVGEWTGKLKVSQNRNEADRAGVRAGLEQAGEPSAAEMARLLASFGGAGP